MTTQKIKITDEKFDINLKLYFFLKHLVKSKLTSNQISKTLEIYTVNKITGWQVTVENIQHQITQLGGQQKRRDYAELIEYINNQDDLELFIFSLRLYAIKDLLLSEAKLKTITIAERLASLPPLSLEYDKLSVMTPYSARVNGALLALVFFEKLAAGQSDFMSQEVEDFLKSLSISARRLVDKGVEPNQIFMLMFNESINQSIISNSGSNYEERIFSVLTGKMGLRKEEIECNVHDKTDASTEYDFRFKLQDNRSYGIGAKRTLRERYKQFIKTAHASDIDVMITVTIGLDLTEYKAITIRENGVYIFVADEVYKNNHYLQKQQGVFPTSELTETILLSLK